MKRKPIVFALTVLLVVGAALWGVNYRLDHPPLTKADKEFRALIAGADSIEVYRATPNPATKYGNFQEHITLNAEQTEHLIENLRFTNVTPIAPVYGKNRVEFFSLIFINQKKLDTGCSWDQTPKPIDVQCSKLFPSDIAQHGYKLNPRFNKRLNRALDAYLPQRIRP